MTKEGLEGLGTPQPALTCPGPILPLTTGQPLLVVLLLLGTDPFHPVGCSTRCSRAPQAPTTPSPCWVPATPLGPSRTSECPNSSRGLGGAPSTLPFPPKTHSLPFELSQRLLLSLPVGAHALHEAGSEQRNAPAAMGTAGGEFPHPAPSGTLQTPPAPPGSLQGGSLEVQHDVQEVVAEEDTALEQEEEEADAVPDDASLLHWQRAVLVLAHLLGWQTEGWRSR